jgi:hypothetical protein
MGLLGPSFAETGDEMRNEDEKSIYEAKKKKKKGGRGGGLNQANFLN